MGAINESIPFEVEIDAKEVTLAATLDQNGRPVAFFSRTIQDSELKHTSVEKETQAITEAVRHWRHILTERSFILETDQKSVTYTFNQQHKSDKIWDGGSNCHVTVSTRRTSLRQLCRANCAATEDSLQKLMCYYATRVLPGFIILFEPRTSCFPSQKSNGLQADNLCVLSIKHNTTSRRRFTSSKLPSLLKESTSISREHYQAVMETATFLISSMSIQGSLLYFLPRCLNNYSHQRPNCAFLPFWDASIRRLRSGRIIHEYWTLAFPGRERSGYNPHVMDKWKSNLESYYNVAKVNEFAHQKSKIFARPLHPYVACFALSGPSQASCPSVQDWAIGGGSWTTSSKSLLCPSALPWCQTTVATKHLAPKGRRGILQTPSALTGREDILQTLSDSKPAAPLAENTPPVSLHVKSYYSKYVV